MIGDTVEQSAAQLRAAIDTYLYGLEDTLTPIEQRLGDDIAGSLDGVHGKLIDPATRLYTVIDEAIGDDETASLSMPAAADRIRNEISAKLSAYEQSVAQVSDRVNMSLATTIDSLLPSGMDAISAIVQVLSDLVGGFLGSLTDTGDFWTALTTTIMDWAEHHKDGAAAWSGDVLQDLINRALGYDAKMTPWSDPKRPIDPGTLSGGSQTVEQNIADWNDTNFVTRALSTVAALIVNIYSLESAKGASWVSKEAQRAMAVGTPSPLSTGELTALLRIGEIGRDFATEHAKRTGTSPELFDLKAKLTRSFLTVDQMIDLWRRTGTDNALDDLPHLGFNDRDIERLKALALAVAQPSDVVRFLARDVFDPAAIAAGGLDVDYDKKYDAHFFNAAGVSKELGKLYWMAHWSLPSPTMGYEMLHRGFIDQTQLEELLKLADYAPGWVQNLINIAYNVPGRIDVRRMYQAGIITTHDELVKRHQDMGYSPADADVLASFVEKIAAQQAETKAERTRAPLVAAIVHSFVSGTMSEGDAHAALVSVGMTDEGATFRLRAGEYERERDKADRIRKAIGREYVRGFLSDADVYSRLTGYGFEAEEIAFLVDSWQLDRELAEESDEKRHEKDLTKSEILAAFHDRLQDRTQSIADLIRLGYDAQESDTLLKIEESKQQQADARAAEQSLHTQFVNRRLSAEETANALLGFGLTADRVAALMSRWGVERDEKRPDITGAQLERLIMRGLIEPSDAQVRLGRLGYTDEDADLILRLWGADMAVVQALTDEKIREFNIREERLTRQGDTRLGLTARAQDLVMDRFTASQQALQERFSATQQQQRELQQQRLDSSSALQSERLAAQTARDAAAFANRRAIQARQIEAEQARIDKQIAEKQRAQEAALADREVTRQQHASLQRERLAAADVSQQRTIDAAATRQQTAIEAADRRARQHADDIIDLTERRQQNAIQLTKIRDDLTAARDIRQQAAKVAQDTRTEQARIRAENRSQARKDITAATVASQQAQLQSLQLQQSSAIAEINARFAALQALQATDRAQAALELRNNAIRELTSNMPATTLLDTTGF